MSDPAAAHRPDYGALFRLDGRLAVVVGGGSGIGRESALALAAQGARVVVADRDLAAAQETCGLGEGLGGGPAGAGLTAYELDILDEAAIERAATELGAVDVLVVTAGVNVRKRLLDYSGAEFDRVVGLNLRAHFDLVRAFGRGMAQRGRGSIIAFSSMRAVLVEPGQGVYAATKAGLVPETAGPFTRVGFVPGLGYFNEAVGAAFGIPVGGVGMATTDEAVVVMTVSARTEASRAAWEAQKDAQRERTVQAFREQRVRLYLEGLRRTAKIEDHRRKINAQLRRQAATTN